jgi:hypothetical protein
MGILLSTAITNVRSLLDEASAQFWSDSQLTSWINEGCMDSQRRAEWKEGWVTLPVIPNVQNFQAPSDAIRIHRVTFIPTNSTNTYTLEFRGVMEMDQVWGIQQQWPANYPLYYTLWGQPGTSTLQIITYPVPSQSGNLNVLYYPETQTVTATNINIDAPQGFEDMVYDYAVYRALRRDADPRWQESKKDYEEKLVALIDSSRTYQDQAGTFSTGQQALPQWLTSSDGW